MKKIFSICCLIFAFTGLANANCTWFTPDWSHYNIPNPVYLLYRGDNVLLCGGGAENYGCKINTIEYGTCNYCKSKYPIPIFYICTKGGWMPYSEFDECEHDCPSSQYKIVTVLNNMEICYIETVGGGVGELCRRKRRQTTTCQNWEYWDGYKCVSKSDLCDKSGGVWRDGRCLCSGDLTNDTSGCSCRCRCNNTKYIYDRKIKQCVEKTSNNSGNGTCPGGCGNDIDIINNNNINNTNQNNFNPTINITVNGGACQTGNCPTVDAGNQQYVTQSDTTVQNINNEIDAIYARIIGTQNDFASSEWRDEQGNFNTARLASDSIAGVVLGTVGGIVTANVVKKAQVKQGFEDMKCSIGGQSVANFGDEFTVGR